MAEICFTAVQDQGGVKVDCFSTGGHGPHDERRFCLTIKLGQPGDTTRTTIGIHGFSEGSVEHFLADIYNAVHDAINQAHKIEALSASA